MEVQKQQNLAKYTFLYLLSLVTLIMTTLAVGNVLFEVINKFIADPLLVNGVYYDPTVMKMAIATLIIAGPIYFVTTSVILKSLAIGMLNKEAIPRRWLSYLIILISSFVMLGFLISVLFSFLDGELTMRFALKSLVALLLSGGIFGFYFYDVRRDQVEQKDKVILVFGLIGMTTVLASLITSFFFVESPTAARNRKHDQSLVANFEQIDSGINSYFNENKKLPDNLSVLVNEKRFITELMIKDLITNEPIVYNILGEKKYQICATFSTSNIGVSPNIDYSVTRWPHKQGSDCISQQIFQADKGPVNIPTNGATVPIK